MIRVLFLAGKEFTQLRRDWRTLALTLFLPVAVLLLFGYAITLDIKEIDMAVVDHDNSLTSRELISMFRGSDYFKVTDSTMDDARRMLEERGVKLVMVIPSDFQKKQGQSSASDIQILLDGSESNSSSIALGYAQAILQDFAFQRTIDPVVRAGLIEPQSLPPVKLVSRARFNPEMDSTTFIVPGLVAMIMMITVVVLSSLSIVKERELGTLETILVSPLRRPEFILGKLAPYFALGFADLFLILGAGVFLFGVPFRGSLILLLALSGLFIVGGLAMGLLISTLADTQRSAWMIALLSTLLPSIVLSGFVFPIRMMPAWLQAITYLVPVRYYLVIVRGVVLKGASAWELREQIFALFVFAALMLGMSVARFNKKIK